MIPITQLRKTHLVGLLLFFVVITIATYINRFPTGDDAWFGEQSYWLEKEGIIRSEFFRGIVGWENQILVSHKLFLAFGAIVIHFFGYDLPILKISGLLFFVIMIGQIMYYINKSERTYKLYYALAIAILIFSNRLLIKMSFENRPEMMVAAFGFGSFLMLNFYNKNWLAALLSGILAGLAFLTHLNGCIYVIAGFACLCMLKAPLKTILSFLLGAAITCSLYFIDVFTAQNGLEMWWFQFRNDPATQASFDLYGKIIQLITYPRLFFQSPEQLALSVLVTYLLWTQRKLLNALPMFLKVYFPALVISFWLITKANAGMYLVLFIPFMLVLTYELYRLKPFTHRYFKWLLALYFVIGIFGSVQLIQKNITLGYLPKTYQSLEKILPRDKVGVVPLTFFFNEYDNFETLRTHENYKLYCHKVNMTPDGFGRWAKASNAGFILMDYQFNPEKFFPPISASNIENYHRTYFDGRFAVYLLVE
ncbi:hypothetical protein [Dyadobacter psychrophilus]|uniref:Dolichyl-phosphate-mannose-protein mannosyltransferase n=1 Tax=Dyadobacter psychrophilus TaxID=651661 RepID=A0A1T5GZR1_9BACT|nr:hypothetical protein [Dyadobacter psychrophilus]SKC13885.1 hypothetical protein SAMN05660293_04666 [Dyadobacter psychrophilus]